jgi:hypothetical protein
MSATTAFRAGRGCLELWSERAPKLTKLGFESWEAADAGNAQGEFRDELIAMARDSTEIAIREFERGLDDLDAFTRPDEAQAETGRQHKVKQ